MTASSSSTAETHPTPSAPSSDWLSWLLGTSGGCVGLAMLLAHLSPELKRLGLLAAAYGGACGLLAAWFWQHRMQCSPSRRTLLLVVLWACMGNTLLTWLSWREYRGHVLQTAQDPQTLLALKLLETDAEQNSVSRARLAELQASLNPGFGDYLRFRLQALGKWPLSAAIAFWCGETLLAGLLAGLVFDRWLGRQQSRP